MAKKSTALTKITAQAKKIRNSHPRMEWNTAIKEASKQYNNGSLGTVAAKKTVGKSPVKRKKTVGKKPASVTRYKTTGGGNATETVYKTRSGSTNVKTVTSKRVSGVDKVVKINREIERLEVLRKKQVGKQAKDAIQVFINAEHKKLKNIISSKRRSA